MMAETADQPISPIKVRFTMSRIAFFGSTATIRVSMWLEENLTDEMKLAPHGEETLERVKLVGVLVS